MADLHALRDEFVASFEAGDAPRLDELLERVEPSERQELEGLIDGYLMTAPRREWDPVAFEGSLAKVAVDRVFESREGVSGTWPELLPSLRDRARLRRADLVQRLAAALGVGTGAAQVDKVARYYNEMEHGQLPAEGVSDELLGTLADIVGSTLETLKAAGGGLTEPPAGPAAAYARIVVSDTDFAAGAPTEAPAAGDAPSERDRIDDLFTGG